ncbi:MAG: HD domain-containing protein [Anaerolineae bacterium]
MKSIFTPQLRVGDELDNEPFLLQGVVRRTTKDGRPYLLFLLRDKKGQVNAVFWNVPDYVDGWVKDGTVALVTGRVVSYKDSLQVTVTDLNPDMNPDMADFLSSSRRTEEEMVRELRQQIKSLQEPWQTLTEHLLLNEEFLPKFASSPAARSMHHAYIGGLLEHTLSMATMADYMSDHYPRVDRSLLIAGALLHDMGKVHAYTIEGEFAFSDDGRLVGHIVRAITMVETAAAELDILTTEQIREIVHLIASHHGTLEFGSPVTPKTLEAILLHQIDLLDSRVQGYFDYLDSDEGDGVWTSKSSPMFRSELRHPLGNEA